MAINQEEVFGALLPIVYVDRIILKDTNVEIQFHIKETFLENGKTSLSYDYLQKSIFIKIEQVTNPQKFLIAKNNKTSNLGEVVKTFQLSTLNLRGTTIRKQNIVETHYSCSFILQKSYSELNFIIYSDFDYDQLSKQFNFLIDKERFDIKKRYEDVLTKGKVVKVLERYMLSNGTEWLGFVVGNKSMGFTTNEIPRRVLTREEYSNLKVQDLRTESIPPTSAPQSTPSQTLNQNRQRQGVLLRGRQPSLPSSLNSQILNQNSNNNNLTETSVNNNLENTLKTFISRQEIIADYYEIIDDNNFVSFVFSINFENLIRKENTSLTQFINSNNIQQILDKTFINNCYLYRTKKLANKTNNSNYIPKELREKVSNLFQEYKLLHGTTNKKTFLIKDNSSNIIDSGIYEYSLELNISNGIIEYLIDKIRNLHNHQKNLVAYANLSSFPKYYNKKLNVFNMNEMQRMYQELQIEQIVVDFVAILGEINFYTRENITQISNTFKNYTNPSTATIETIKYVLSFYQQTLNNLYKYSGIKIENDGTFLNQSANKDSLITVKKTFKNLINLDRQYKVKLNFVDINDNVINYRNLVNSFERVIQQYNLTNASNEIKESIYSCLPPRSVTINKQNITITNDTTNYLESIFTNINLTLNKKSKYLLNLSSSPNNNDVLNCLNFSKLVEQDGVVIEGDLIKPLITKNLNVNDSQYYSSNKSLYDCITGLSKVFNYNSAKYLDFEQNMQNQTNYLSTIPTITKIGFEQTNTSTMNNLLFTSGKYIMLYRIIYDLEFLDVIDGEVVWNKLTKNIFETKFQNKSILFRLKQNSSSILYDTSDMKAPTNFIVNFN